jgi:hypothetical protein
MMLRSSEKGPDTAMAGGDGLNCGLPVLLLRRGVPLLPTTIMLALRWPGKGGGMAAATRGRSLGELVVELGPGELAALLAPELAAVVAEELTPPVTTRGGARPSKLAALLDKVG